MAGDDDQNIQERDANAKARKSVCGCKSGKPTVCNPLLAYAASAMGSNPKNVIKRVVMGFYTPEEIYAAKEDLWSNFDEQIIGPNVNRKGSKNKKRHESVTEDILDALEALDAKQIHADFHVSAIDLCRIPPNQPSEMLDFALADRITDLEIKLTGSNGVMNQMATLIEDNRRLNRLIAQMEQSTQASASYANRAAMTSSSSIMPTPHPSHPSSQRVSQSNQQQLPQLRMQSRLQQQQSSSETLLKQPQHAVNSGADDGFRIPTQHIRQNRRRERLMGTRSMSSNSRFQGAPPPKRQLFIYRAQRETTCEDICAHVEDLNLDSPEIEKVECVSHDEAKYKSFVVTCSIETFKVLLNGDLWPVGCGVRKYNPPRNGRERASGNADPPNLE